MTSFPRFSYCWLVYVAIGATSIVEPQGFSGSLPVLLSMCCQLSLCWGK